MKIFELKRTQKIPITLQEAWAFFSTPKNLQKITPDYLKFNITSDLGDGKMYPGQVITYKVRPLLNIPINWMTEITHVDPLKYFVDEQRFGPYALWHHKHFFKEIENGVEMKDVVHYAMHFWQGGPIINKLFVRKKLGQIFDYRVKKVEEIFGSYD